MDRLSDITTELRKEFGENLQLEEVDSLEFDYPDGEELSRILQEMNEQED